MEFKRQIIIISAVLSLSLVLLIRLAVYPLFKTIRSQSEELLSTKEKLMAITEKNKELFIWKEDYPGLEPDLMTIQALLVNSEMPIGFLQFLEKTAEGSGVSIETSLLSSADKGVSIFPSLSFRLSLIGLFPNCLKFLDKLENAPYLLEIQGLTSSRLSEERLRMERYQGFSKEDTELSLLIKVFANNENQN